jgi:hypothetical protein
VQTLLQDIRYALRQLRHSPAFTLTALLTLAIGIGATTAIFTPTQAIMLKSLPVADPARLYRIGDTGECCVEGWEDDDWSLLSHQLYQRLAAAAPEFEETTAFQAAPGIYSIRQQAKDREARPLRTEYVSGSYFHVFGLGAFAGRVINNSDDQESASPVATASNVPLAMASIGTSPVQIRENRLITAKKQGCRISGKEAACAWATSPIPAPLSELSHPRRQSWEIRSTYEFARRWLRTTTHG